MNDTLSTEKTSPTPSGKPVDAAPPCSDCGKPSCSPLLMNTCVGGDFRYLCEDCWEEDFEGIMQEPCPRCHGSGTEWEGWSCEECGGDGTSIY